MTDEPPNLLPGLPEGIVRVLERSMVLDVDSRFPTAAGMQRAIEAAMKEMGEAATSEDVAAFMRSELPELAQKRKEILNKAIDEAASRGLPSGETKAAVQPEEAFAPTVMSERQPKPQPPPSTRRDGARMDRPSDAGTIALVKKREGAAAVSQRQPLPANDVSSALDQEPIEIPKTSKAWLWIMLLLLVGGGGAYYRWPNQIKGWFARMGIGGGTDSGLQAIPVPTDSTATPATTASTAAAATSAPRPASSPSASAASSAPSARASASASAGHPEPSGTHHTWPAGHEPSGTAPTASAEPAPTTSWSPWKQPPQTAPAPAPASSDNPYP
jgi:hypothetical protein